MSFVDFKREEFGAEDYEAMRVGVKKRGQRE